jgi:hypothetical protein
MLESGIKHPGSATLGRGIMINLGMVPHIPVEIDEMFVD